MMKKLLFTITTTLLFNFAHSGYAAPGINGLNDLPDEIKLHIALQLSTDDQKNLGMVNHSFNAIMADDAVLTQKTAREFGIEFSHIDNFGKELVKNVIEGNFAITVCDTYYGLQKMMHIDEANGIIRYSLDNNGHIDIMQSILRFDGYLTNDYEVNLLNTNYDISTFVGYRNIFEQQAEDLYDGPTVAVKYMTATNEWIDLFPADNGFSSYGNGLNSDGSIIVGDINDNKNIYGFVQHNDGNTIFLKNPQHVSYSKPSAVSDQGEIVTGFAANNSHAAAIIWLHDADNNDYHPCLLYDLIIQNCSDAQRQLLQDNYFMHFTDILAVSPNGKAMFVQSGHAKRPYGHYLIIMFGSKVAAKVPNFTVPQN